MLRRITLLATGVAALAVVLFAIPLGVIAGRGYVNDERLELQRQAVSAAAAVRGELGRPAPDVAPARTDLGVYDNRGRLRNGTGPAIGGADVRAALSGRESTSLRDDRVQVAAPVSDGDQVTGAVLLSRSLSSAHARANRAWLVLAAIGLLALALAALAARVLARRLTAPVNRLTATAKLIGDGDLTARAQRSGVPELDVLVGTLNAGTERVETLVARERRLSGEVSHQLRTPVAGLRLQLEAAQGTADPMTRAAVDRALLTLDRFDVTIREVIALARDLPGERALDLDALISGAEQRWHGVLAATSRPLRVVRERDLPARVAIAPAAAGQIIDVLVDNARAHGRGAVTIGIRRSRTAVAVDVTDDGPRLDTEPHELFGRRADGHGIGLAFARRLAQAEGARLLLSSREPPTFTLLIPVG